MRGYREGGVEHEESHPVVRVLPRRLFDVVEQVEVNGHGDVGCHCQQIRRGQPRQDGVDGVAHRLLGEDEDVDDVGDAAERADAQRHVAVAIPVADVQALQLVGVVPHALHGSEVLQ